MVNILPAKYHLVSILTAFISKHHHASVQLRRATAWLQTLLVPYDSSVLLLKNAADIFPVRDFRKFSCLHPQEWFGQFVPLCDHQMVKFTDCITLSPWEPNDDSLSAPLSAETVHILLSLARHTSIYQQNHSLLLKLFEVWPTFHVLHFQNLHSVFSLQ